MQSKFDFLSESGTEPRTNWLPLGMVLTKKNRTKKRMACSELGNASSKEYIIFEKEEDKEKELTAVLDQGFN